MSDSTLPRLRRTVWELRPGDGGPPIRGDLRVREGASPSSAVVVCHGFKGFREWGFFPYLGRALASAGHAVLTFDFSHNGVGADGRDFSALDLFARNTHSRNVAEIGWVVDAIRQGRFEVEPDVEIGLVGHSRGGGEAILAAGANGHVRALVTWAAVATVRRWSEEQVAAWRRGETVHIENSRTRQRMPILPSYWEDIEKAGDRLDIRRAAASLALPWLLVHGEQDETVDVADAHALFEAAGADAEMLLIEGAGHTFGAVHPFAGGTPELEAAIDATLEWFDAHLRRGPTRVL